MIIPVPNGNVPIGAPLNQHTADKIKAAVASAKEMTANAKLVQGDTFASLVEQMANAMMLKRAYERIHHTCSAFLEEHACEQTLQMGEELVATTQMSVNILSDGLSRYAHLAGFDQERFSEAERLAKHVADASCVVVPEDK